MESKFHYTNERNVQIVISLLKAHGIHRVIASPGTTNMTFVASIQNDSWFTVWSSVDERSAAYMACGIAAETGEPIVISCTGATASRNYMPGLTEAYYRKLPVLAITSTRGNHKIGHLIDQQIDRRNIPNDIVVESVTVPTVKDQEDEHFCEIEVNKAILALKLNGGGPSHINLYTTYSKDLSVTSLPQTNAIYRHTIYDEFPILNGYSRIAIFAGSHKAFSMQEIKIIDEFCASNDSVVFVERSSTYNGKYAVCFNIVSQQIQYHSKLIDIDLLIHLGEVTTGLLQFNAKEIWRVSEDGKLRDTFGKLSRVFMMPEQHFFEHYANATQNKTKYLRDCKDELSKVMNMCPPIPFSNIWIAQNMCSKIPPNSCIHLGILNSLRSWSYVQIPKNVETRSTVGGYGIDGGVSSLIGSSLVNQDRIHIGIFGDLGFFYDMNVLGNRHVGKNVRILIINNGEGVEFRTYNHPCFFLGDAADEFIAAAGHYGNKSATFIRDFAKNLGYEYLKASNKKEFLQQVDRFTTVEITDAPMVFEVFTMQKEETKAIEIIQNIVKEPTKEETTNSPSSVQNIKRKIKSVLGENRINGIKLLLKG